DARKLVLLVTDARPGSFDDTFVAGVHDVRAHQLALDARAKGIAISAVYTATDESQPYQETIRRIMSDYAQTTGGGYLATAGDGRETDRTLRRILDACGAGGAIMPEWDELGVLLPWTLPFLVLLLVAVRNELVRLIGVVFDIPIRLLVELVHALSRAVSGLLQRYREAVEGQRVVARGVPGPRSPWIGWWLIWPLVYLLFVALVAIPDVVVSSERLAAMFGFASTGQDAPVNLQW